MKSLTDKKFIFRCFFTTGLFCLHEKFQVYQSSYSRFLRKNAIFFIIFVGKIFFLQNVFFFLFWTNGSPNTLYSCLKCILVRFSDWSKAASSSGLGGTPSLVALDLQAAWNVGIIWLPLDSYRRLLQQRRRQGGQLPRTRAHEPLPEPLLHGLQEVASRQTS